MKILVTGASGFVGRKLFSSLRSNYEVIGTYFRNKNHNLLELDIANSDAVERLFEEEKPDFVIHAAGVGRHGEFEANPVLGDAINVGGTRNVARACINLGVTLAYVSSVFVFDGAKQTPYTEVDSPAPINLYGQSKLKAEAIVQKVPGSIILRTDMIYGYNGKRLNNGFLGVIARTQSQLGLNAEDMRQPLFADDLAKAIVTLVESRSHGLFHLAGHGHLTQFELGLKIERLLRNHSKISPTTRSNGVSRPKRILLDTTKAEEVGIKFTSVDRAILTIKKQISQS